MSDALPEVVKATIDVKSAIEWAWLNMESCILRDQNNIPVAIDFEKSLTKAPAGGKQMLDLAFTNKVAFQKDFVLKVLGNEIDDEDDIAIAEKKSIGELRKLLVRFEEAAKKKKSQPSS